MENIDDNATFVEKLNWLEKHYYIPSARDWIRLRHFCNSLAHDYPCEPSVKLQLLKQLMSYCDELECIFEQVKHRYLLDVQANGLLDIS